MELRGGGRVGHHLDERVWLGRVRGVLGGVRVSEKSRKNLRVLGRTWRGEETKEIEELSGKEQRGQDPPAALGACMVPCRPWETLSAPWRQRSLWGLRGGCWGGSAPSPFLDLAPGLAGSLSTFLRCLPPMPQGCLQLGQGLAQAVCETGAVPDTVSACHSLHIQVFPATLWPMCLEGIMTPEDL